MKRQSPLQIWFVDDLHANLAAWLGSFEPELRSRHQFRCFASVETLFEALDAGELPDVLFIDYYIGPRFGHEVIAYFKGWQQRPVLVAHSSMPEANQVMLNQGADLMLEKTPGTAVTASIMALIRSEADLYQLAGF